MGLRPHRQLYIRPGWWSIASHERHHASNKSFPSAWQKRLAAHTLPATVKGRHSTWVGPFFKAHNSHKTNKHKHNSASLTSQFRVPFLHSSPTIPVPQPHPVPHTSSRLKCEAVLCAETPCNKYDDGYGAQAASSRNHPIRSRPSGGQKKAVSRLSKTGLCGEWASAPSPQTPGLARQCRCPGPQSRSSSVPSRR